MNRDRILTVIICTIAILFAIVFKSAPVIYYNQGKNYLQKQDYVSAYKKLKKAYLLNHKNKDYKYYYVLSLTKLSPTLNIQKEIFKVSQLQERDSAEQLAADKINKWKTYILNSIGENYIEQVPGERGIIRWDLKKFPLKIYIQKDTEVPAYYRTQIINSLNQWQSSVEFIKFTLTDKPSKAELLIKIKPTPDNVCDNNSCRYVTGFTQPKYKGNILKQMEITLYSKEPNGNYFSDKEVYNTSLHEIGHALGIMGHSYSKADLMYMENKFYSPDSTSFNYLSAKDLNTIKLLYKLNPDITNTPKPDTKGLIYAPIILGDNEQINLKKLKEAQNYIKNAPDLPGGYIDLGIAYAELGNKKEAIKALEQAIKLAKTDNDKYISYFNLAIIYFNNKDTSRALDYALKAQNISDTEDIKELIMEINNQKKH